MLNFFSIEQVRQSPISQAVFGLFLCIVVSAGAFLLNLGGIIAVTSHFYWLFCTTILLVFIIVNTSYGTRANDIISYAKHSLYSFVGLMLSTNYLAKFASGVAIRDTKGFAWLYVVLIVCYLTFFSITLILKQLWSFFEKENDVKLRKDGQKK